MTISCNTDKVFVGNFPDFYISADTLTFDTVFTRVGSATRFVKLYNNENEDIFVDIKLNETQSSFRINVDGVSGDYIKNIRIGANDSIYIFADVTVDPDQPISISPFVIEESLTILSNEQKTTLTLIAWGQNANYIPGKIEKGQIFTYSCDLGQKIWDDPKPYVIYGIMILEDCELVLPQGTNVYIHGGVVANIGQNVYNEGLIIVRKSARIITEGTVEQPVTFQGDRLEHFFDNIAGQWSGIILSSQSLGNTFTHTIMKNSTVGIRVDSLAELSLDGCEIGYTSSSGLIGINAQITAKNTLIHANGGNALTVIQGGNYQLDYCTLVSYGNKSRCISMTNVREYIGNLSIDSDNIFVVQPLDAQMTNCIVTGSDEDEIVLFDYTNNELEKFRYQFDNSIVQVKELLQSNRFSDFFDFCNQCIKYNGEDPLFENIYLDNYTLDSMSVAEEKASPLSVITIDKDGNLRDLINPDIGCYEYLN